MRVPLAFFGAEQAGPAWATRYRMEWAQHIERADGRPYILIARHFDVAPGELLGSEGVERPITDAELTMVRVVRNLRLTPDEAIARLMSGRYAGADGSGARDRDP